jgi:hypothetical protein
MSKRNIGIHPALKHGVYSGTALLPGEDPGEFEKLHNKLIAEFAPAGPLEQDIVANMARLIWRKQISAAIVWPCWRNGGFASFIVSLVSTPLLLLFGTRPMQRKSKLLHKLQMNRPSRN